MKYKITEYRNQDIYYNEDSDKFEVEILTNEELQPKHSKRSTLIDVKKSIDEHFESNANFKPFKALFAKYGVEAKEVIITSIRKDGGVVIEYLDGKKEQLHNIRFSDLKYLYQYSNEYLQIQRDAIKNIDCLQQSIKKIQSELINKRPQQLDLSFINDFL